MTTPMLVMTLPMKHLLRKNPLLQLKVLLQQSQLLLPRVALLH